jgi:hypothetical protein
MFNKSGTAFFDQDLTKTVTACCVPRGFSNPVPQAELEPRRKTTHLLIFSIKSSSVVRLQRGIKTIVVYGLSPPCGTGGKWNTPWTAQNGEKSSTIAFPIFLVPAGPRPFPDFPRSAVHGRFSRDHPANILTICGSALRVQRFFDQDLT